MSIRPLLYGHPLEIGVGDRDTVFSVPLSSLEDHSFFRFEPDLHTIMNQGNTSLVEPLIVKRPKDRQSHKPFIILSGHVRKRIAQMLRHEEIQIQVIDEREIALTLKDEIEIMKKENRDQLLKREKLEFIFDHFGEEFGKENRLGKLNEGKETKEVGVLIERASLGRIPRGTASRLIADKRRELLKRVSQIPTESLKESIIDGAENTNSDSSHLSENLLLGKELSLPPDFLKQLIQKISELDVTSRLGDIAQQKLRILLKDLLIITIRMEEKRGIDEQIKNLKRKSEEKQEGIIELGNQISEFLSAGTIDQLKQIKELDKENFEKISKIVGTFPSLFRGIEKLIGAWEIFLLPFGITLPKKKFPKYVPDKNDPESSYKTMSHQGGIFIDKDHSQIEKTKKSGTKEQ